MPSLNSGRRLVNGFTLVELMITLAVAVVVLTIGLPSFRSLQLNNERTARMNELLGSLQLARGEVMASSSAMVGNSLSVLGWCRANIRQGIGRFCLGSASGATSTFERCSSTARELRSGGWREKTIGAVGGCSHWWRDAERTKPRLRWPTKMQGSSGRCSHEVSAIGQPCKERRRHGMVK